MDIAYRTFPLPHAIPILSPPIPPQLTPTPKVPDQIIPPTALSALSKPPTALQATNPTTGETGYRVGVEVFHQLHCLNLLRMATYPEYYSKLWWSDTNDEPEKVRAHLGKLYYFASLDGGRWKGVIWFWSDANGVYSRSLY